jgi:hypothetical protein
LPSVFVVHTLKYSDISQPASPTRASDTQNGRKQTERAKAQANKFDKSKRLKPCFSSLDPLLLSFGLRDARMRYRCHHHDRHPSPHQAFHKRFATLRKRNAVQASRVLYHGRSFPSYVDCHLHLFPAVHRLPTPIHHHNNSYWLLQAQTLQIWDQNPLLVTNSVILACPSKR